MKKLVVVLVAAILSIGTSFAGSNPGLIEEIEEKVIIDLNGVELDRYNEDYVIVSFQIIDDEIKIQEINGSSDQLKEKVIKELYAIHVDSAYESGKTYNFRFTFDEQ